MGSIKAFSAARKITKAMSYTTASAGSVYEDDRLSQNSGESRFKSNNTSPGKSQGFSIFKGKITFYVSGHIPLTDFVTIKTLFLANKYYRATLNYGHTSLINRMFVH